MPPGAHPDRPPHQLYDPFLLDSYPPDYISHNLPLIVLSGLTVPPSAPDGNSPTTPSTAAKLSPLLGRKQIEITSEAPIVSGERAEQLLEEFNRCEKTDEQWNGKSVQGRSGLLGFKFRAIGRDYHLPPRKAEPPSEAHTVEQPSSPSSKGPAQWVLHSPISPLSPGSPIFPDGVMTDLWISKHQNVVPSVFISFFEFISDPARNSLLDNQLKNEINNIKATLYRSEYKTRYVVVLLSDKTILEAPDIEERLANIRRATSLDAKNAFFFLPPNVSRVEMASFVESLLSTLQPLCVEYYRDLTKHARRKKNRGSIPPPTAPPTRGTSQTLASLGWGVRYDYKLGIFAEFRQEMEAACRHYTSALESLIGPDGIFETTASWSPRWDEARLLSDSLALRVIRCLLWSNLTTTAAQSWSNYRDRMRELVDRRGKGSSNYGWEAWESRWAKVMAELIRRGELAPFQLPEGLEGPELLEKREIKIFAPVEKTFPVGERLSPWHHLHHPGYWWRQAAKHTKLRRHLASQLPEEDRVPPGQSPASAMASRYGTYDTYLCPEPHVEYASPENSGYDHSADILTSLSASLTYYKARSQTRLTNEISLEISKELMQSGEHVQALETLFQLWEEMSWRREKWWRLVYEVTQNLHRCAKLVGNLDVMAATQFELYSNMLPFARGFQYDLMGSGIGTDRGHGFPRHETEDGHLIKLTAETVTSFLSASLHFSAEEGYAGEPIAAQLSVTSTAHAGTSAVTLQSITVQLEGGASTIILSHVPSTLESHTQSQQSHLQNLSLTETSTPKAGSSSFAAEADLTVYPGQTIVLEFALAIREAGAVSVNAVILSIKTESFALTYTLTPSSITSMPNWWIQGPKNLRTRRIGRDEPSRIQILPRPPRMELRIPGADRQFYTDESVVIAIELSNGEDEDTESTLEVRLLTRDGPAEFDWVSSSPSSETSDTGLPGHHIGNLTTGEARTESILFTAPPEPSEYVLEVKVLYHLFSDKETPVSRTHSVNLNIVRAFEANYDFVPRLHEKPWPTLFGMSSLPSSAQGDGQAEKRDNGIMQRWHLTAGVASFATEALVLSDVDLMVRSCSGGANVVAAKESNDREAVDIAPQEQKFTAFILEVTKSTLEERRSTTLDLGLKIVWKHADSLVPDGAEVTTILPIPPFSIPNSEPRVLCTATRPQGTGTVSPSSSAADSAPTDLTSLHEANTIVLTYTLENPTTHFLTFDLAMEATDDFAFSGSKLRSVNLLPLARVVVTYRILPLVEGDVKDGGGTSVWIGVKCRVVDRYFKKVLRVLAAGNGVREGKGGGLEICIGG